MGFPAVAAFRVPRMVAVTHSTAITVTAASPTAARAVRSSRETETTFSLIAELHQIHR
jgi:hypothetical protein